METRDLVQFPEHQVGQNLFFTGVSDTLMMDMLMVDTPMDLSVNNSKKHSLILAQFIRGTSREIKQ